MKNFRIAQSDTKDVVAAVKSIKEQLSDIDACMILYFASPVYPAEAISKEMFAAFPGTDTVGCTTAGEMISGKIGHNSIVAMAWHKVSMKYLKIEILENIQTDTDAVAQAFKSFEKSLGTSMQSLDSERYVGMIMIDGLSGCEERLNDQLGNLTNVSFIGGSAGDNFMFQRTWLFLNGRAYTNAALLLLMEPTNGYATLKTQSFSITDKKLIPTKVDEKQRMVIEFNNQPASVAYAEAVGIPIEELSKSLGEYPIGLIFDEQNYFVRSPKQIEGTSMTFYCLVKEGLEVRILKPKDIVETTSTDLQKCGNIQAVVDFNCAQRFDELIRKNQLKTYSEIFKDVPAIGFSTYGESYIGHINQTSTMLLLK